jgi:hypothetical protein
LFGIHAKYSVVIGVLRGGGRGYYLFHRVTNGTWEQRDKAKLNYILNYRS